MFGINLNWFYTAISWVMARWHDVFSTVLNPDSGITWALSIVFLVVTIRIVLFRFFIKQVKSQRAMQELQPEIAKLKKQYGADRQGFSQAVMALQKERKVNPLAGCLPILPQIPIFIALLHVLRRLSPTAKGLYSWDDALTHSAATAKLFGAPISASFNMSGTKQTQLLAIASYTNIRIVAMVLIIVMCVTTYTTQRQIMRRSGPVEGQAAMVQKFMLYGMPLSLFVSGFLFPIGVLLYWFTNNLWTLGQQFYILRKLPPPGSPAALAKAGTAEKAVDGRSLAPRPGAKPIRNKPAAAPAAPAAQTPSDAPATPDGEPTDQPATKRAATSAGTSAGTSAAATSSNGASSNGASGSTASGTPANGTPAAGAKPAPGAGQGAGSRTKRKRR